MAANSYTNAGIYIHIFAGTTIPASWKEAFLEIKGEGRNFIALADGSKLAKNMFMGLSGVDVIRKLVHAEDNGKIALLDEAEAKEIRQSIGTA